MLLAPGSMIEPYSPPVIQVRHSPSTQAAPYHTTVLFYVVGGATFVAFVLSILASEFWIASEPQTTSYVFTLLVLGLAFHQTKDDKDDDSQPTESEVELRQQKLLLEQIIETVPDELFVKDCQRRLVLANQAYFDDLDVEPEQIIGKVPYDMIPPAIRDIARETDDWVFQHERATHREVSFEDKQGQTKHHEIRKLPLLEDDKVVGVVCLCRDITEQRQAEHRLKQQETLLLHAARLSSMGELVAGIAHEVNQPLFTILNYAKAIENIFELEQPTDFEAVQNWVRQIHREATRAGKITQRLRSFVKRAPTQREWVDANDIIRESIGFVAAEARNAGVMLETSLADVLPKIFVDRVQIQQVLVNLIKNAVEALHEHDTSDGRVIVSTSHLPSAVAISIVDNGPGLSVSGGINIFEPFQTTKHEGMGLGLAISNTIIEAHGSSLTSTTNELGGATFSFKLDGEDSYGEKK